MNSFGRILKFAAVAAASFIVAGCIGNDGLLASKGDMVPDNAMAAVKVNADQLWNKALGEPGSRARDMWQTGKSMASMYTAEFGEIGDVLRQILNDPDALGVDMKEPMVLSFAGEISEMNDMDGQAEMCLVALLDNSDAFLKVADAAVTFAKAEAGVVVFKDVEKEDYTHYEFVVDEGVSVDLGVTEESAVLRFKFDSTGNTEGLSDSMLALFAGEGPQDTDGIEAFYDSDADLAAWGDFDAMLNVMLPVIEQEDPAIAEQIQPYIEMYAGAAIVYDLDFQDGKTVLNFGVYGSDEMKEYVQKYNKEASDKFFEQLPKSAFVAFNVAFKDFAGLVDEMCRLSPEYAELFEYLEEDYGFSKELFNGFPGLVTFALSGEGFNDVPALCLMMECEESLWEYVKNYLPMYAEADEKGVYNIDEMLYFGYTDGYIFVQDAKSYKGKNSSSFADNPYADIIENGGAVVDFAALPAELLDEVASEIDYYMDGEDLLPYLSSIVVDPSDDFMSATVTLNMGDKNHNLLEKLVLTAVESAF